LVAPKKPRFGPKVASQAWWIERIRDKEGPKYLTYWTHITDYQIGQIKALAEYDYFALGEGIETEGAPDFGLELDYPVKLVGKPFWVNWSTFEFKDFKLWTWIQGSIALERPLGEKTITWSITSPLRVIKCRQRSSWPHSGRSLRRSLISFLSRSTSQHTPTQACEHTTHKRS